MEGSPDLGVFPMSGYDWQHVYHQALVETDWTKIEERIHAAEVVMNERLREFSVNGGGSPEENQAVIDAINALKILRREVADWRARRAG